MLLKFSVNNFMSYKNEASINMLASSNGKTKKKYFENYIVSNGTNILKTALIIGENAGGKSNFIRSLDFLKYLFSISDSSPSSRPNLIFGENLDDFEKSGNIEKTLQNYSLEVVAADGNIYSYELKIDRYGILFEKLMWKEKYKDKFKPVFEVDRNDIKSKDKKTLSKEYSIQLKISKELENLINDRLDSGTINGLFINSFSLLGIPHTKPFVEWIKNKLEIELNSNLSIYLLEFENNKNKEQIKIMETPEFKEIFKLVDSSIIDFNIDFDHPLTDSIITRKFGSKKIKMKMKQESSGVKQFLSLAIEIYKVIYEQKIVIADEIDSMLNPALSFKVVNFINSFENVGQFIFATHNVYLLNLQLYMREQMYIVGKDKKTLSSSIYPISCFPEIRYDSNYRLYEYYFMGLFGGVDND